MHPGFIKDGSRQTNPKAFLITDSPDKGNSPDVICHDFRKAFGTVSLSKFFVSKDGKDFF